MKKRQLGSAARGWPGGSKARTSSIRQSPLLWMENPVPQRLAVGQPKGLECCDKVCVGLDEQRGYRLVRDLYLNASQVPPPGEVIAVSQ